MKVTKNGVKKLSSLKDTSYVTRALMSKSSKDLFFSKRLQVSNIFSKFDSKDKIILDFAHNQNLAGQFGELLKPDNYSIAAKIGSLRGLRLGNNSLRLVGSKLQPLAAGVALSHNSYLSDFERLCAILDITSCKRAQKNLLEIYWGKSYEEKIFGIVHSESNSNEYTLPIFFLFMNFLEFFKHTKDEDKVFKGLEPILDENLDKIFSGGNPVFCDYSWWEIKSLLKYRPQNWKIRQILRKILFNMHLETIKSNTLVFQVYHRIFGTTMEGYSLYSDVGGEMVSKIKQGHVW